jgi:hypothetical protein
MKQIKESKAKMYVLRLLKRTYRVLGNSGPDPGWADPPDSSNALHTAARRPKERHVIPVCVTRPIRRASSLSVLKSRFNGGSIVKRRILVALALVGLLSVVVVSRAGAATKTTSPVTTFAGAVVGTSTLTRTSSGISFSLSTTGLEAGHAVTIWWMVFNPDGSVSVQYAAGHVIDQGGAAQFGGYLQVGDTEGVINGGPGLLDALAANVVLVVRDHGPADPPRVDEQIHTFDDVCNPTCTDLQISMHAGG